MCFFLFSKEEHFLIICSYSRYKEITQENQQRKIYLSMGPADSLLLRFKDLFQKHTQHSFELLPFRVLLPVDRLRVGCTTIHSRVDPDSLQLNFRWVL